MSDSLDGSYDNSKTTGFQLDCNNIPDEILEGTVINFSLTLIPDNNWHFYEYKNGASYHQSKSMGVQDMQSASTTLTGANVNNSDDQTPEEAGVDFYKDVKGNIFGKDTSLSTSTTWSALPPELFGLGSAVNGLLSGGNVNCTYGTSAGNPLILQGGPVSFKASIRATSLIESDGPSKVADAIEACLTYQNATPSQLESILVNFSFELATPFEELQNRPSYSIDLGLQSGQTIGAPFFNQESNGNPYIDLIVAVKRTDSTNLLEYAVPIGYFIGKQGHPNFLL